MTPGLQQQSQQRSTALADLAELRKQAAAEIERLIAFMDASDDYVTTELEEAVDDVPCDENTDSEPSLGLLDSQINQTRIVVGDRGYASDCELDDCDDEQECEDEGGQCDDEGAPDADREPDLGWTVDGCMTGLEA